MTLLQFVLLIAGSVGVIFGSSDVDLNCDPCIDRPTYTIKAIVHGTSNDPFWQQIRAAAIQSGRDMRVNLEFDLYDEYNAEQMASDILGTLSAPRQPDALIVTIPETVVEKAVRVTSESIPIFGMNSGYDRVKNLGIMGFVAMDEYMGGRKAGKEFLKGEKFNITKALYINHQKGNTALDARYKGFADALKEQFNNTEMVNVSELVITKFDDDDLATSRLEATLEAALEGCTYDAILLGGSGVGLESITAPYAKSGCDLTSMPLGTFDTNREVFDAIAVGKLSFAISQQQFLQGALPVVLASVYASTGFTIAESSESESGIYLTGPKIINLRNLPSDTVQICENEGFPVCQSGEVSENSNSRCPCTDRSKIRIGGVLHGETTDAFWDIVFEQIYQASDDLGIDLDIDRIEPQPTPELMHKKMASKIESLCESGVDGLFVTIPSREYIVEAIRGCQSLNIPVVSVNSGSVVAEELGLTHHISQLEYTAGKKAGEYMIREAGITEALCLNIEAGNVGIMERCNGFQSAFEELSEDISYKMVVVDKDKAKSIVVALEEAVGRSGDWNGLAILNSGGSTAEDIIKLKEAHPNFISGSFDINGNVYKGLDEGVFLFAVDQNPFMQGYLPVCLLTFLSATKQNLKNTFIETGPAFIQNSPDESLQQCWSNLFEVCPRPEIHDKKQLTEIRPVGLTLAAIAILGSIFFMGWCCYYRNDPVVKKSQPFFLAMVCFGTLVMASGIIVMGIDDSIAEQPALDYACIAQPWLLSIGFTISFSALYSKIRRINLLMKSAAHFRRLVVKPKDVLITFSIMLMLNIAILLTWTIADPMYFHRSEPIAQNDGVSSTGICEIGHGDISRAMSLSLVVIDFLVVFLANVEAYKARNINTEFSESKYVGLIMMGFLQTILLGVPLIALVRSANPSAHYFVNVAITFVLCMSLLLGIFIPKVLHMKKEQTNKKRNLRVPTRNIPSSYVSSPSCDLDSSGMNNSSGMNITIMRAVSASFVDCYTISKAKIPMIAERVGCDENELTSLLDELERNTKMNELKGQARSGGISEEEYLNRKKEILV